MTDSVDSIEMTEPSRFINGISSISTMPTYYSLYRKKILALKSGGKDVKTKQAKELKLAEKDAEKQAKHQTDKQDKIAQKNLLKDSKMVLDKITKKNQNKSVAEWNVNQL